MNTSSPSHGRATDTRPVAIWLFAIAALIFAMVIIGGVTRLTESGLSITEWRPVTGALPPLSDEAWQAEFERYQEIPEYRERNFGMTLDDYKTIYWWEYVHRLWGRIIGAAFLLPFVWFLFSGRIRGALAWQLGGVFVLGALQGLLGWYMVQSGLIDRVDVSPYRLTAHLGLALAIYVTVLWIGFDLWRAAPRPTDGRALMLTALVFVTMLLGGLVAGNDAGMIYNTFPLMDDRLVPEGYADFDPWWINLFENPAAVQFNHRVFGIATVVVAFGYWLAASRERGWLPHTTFVMALTQGGLGIATLLNAVPLALAVLHQAGALTLLTLALAAARARR